MRPAAALTRLVGAAILLFGLTGAAAAGSPRYVSMGSSYAAGPGVGERDVASGACGRSLNNYARQIAARRGLALVDVSCSGATTETILSKSQAGFPPQIEALTADTRLVTVTIGGNDVAYVANLMGYSCRHTGGACAVTSDAEVEAKFAVLPQAFRTLIAEVHRRAPKAMLILVGYLPVLPEAGQGECIADPLTEPDAARLRAVAARLDAVMQTAARETDTPLVQTGRLGRGHDICGAEPWVAGYKASRNAGWPIGVSYHPNRVGMDHLAQAIDAVLSQANFPAGDHGS